VFNSKIDAPMLKTTKSSAVFLACSNLIINIVFPPFFYFTINRILYYEFYVKEFMNMYLFCNIYKFLLPGFTALLSVLHIGQSFSS
jgi:hypothetical protein